MPSINEKNVAQNVWLLMTQGCDGKAAVKDEVERPELASVSPEPPQWHQLVQATTRKNSLSS